MKLKRIEREISHTITLADYEFIKPTIRCTYEPEGAETVQDAFRETESLWKEVVVQELKECIRRRKATGKFYQNDVLIQLYEYYSK